MSDPLGLIGLRSGAAAAPGMLHRSAGSAKSNAEGPGFREMLERELAQVNRLQEDAKIAAEDLASGKRDDIEGVIAATQKADLAFRMLLGVRNKMMEAYDEVKQIRV